MLCNGVILFGSSAINVGDNESWIYFFLKFFCFRFFRKVFFLYLGINRLLL
jgi:hypothetical protein